MAEPFDCMRDCLAEGEWRDDVRASRACGLPGVHPVAPRPTDEGLYQLQIGTAYMGRHRDRSLEGKFHFGHRIIWERPYEDPEDGCPGAWYRTRWVDSVFPYLRRRTDGGGRVPNPRLDRCEDWLIESAVMYVEDEEERAVAYVDRVRQERLAARQKSQEPQHHGVPRRALGRVRRARSG